MKKILFAVLGVMPLAGIAQQFDISAQLRTRAEYRDGYRQVKPATFDTAGNFAISQRTRLTFEYKSPQLELKFSPQDVHTWGQQKQTTNMPTLSVYEAWAALNLTDNWKLKVGRQEIILDDHRLVGNLDWAQTGRTFDALTTQIQKGKFKLQAGGAFNQLTDQAFFGGNYTKDNFKALAFVHPEWKTKGGVLTATFIADSYQATDMDPKLYWRFTQGVYANQTFDKFSMTAHAYYQVGKNVANLNISAYLASLKLGYAFSNKVSAGIGADFVSGTKSTSTKDNSFNTLYATNHKFYGWMDYYINFPSDTRSLGLNDYYVAINYLAAKKWDFSATGHFFTINSDPGKIDDINYKSNLGQEIDLSANYKLNDFVKLNGGYSFYLVTSTTNYIKKVSGGDGRTGHWAWLSLDISPKIFSFKKD